MADSKKQRVPQEMEIEEPIERHGAPDSPCVSIVGASREVRETVPLVSPTRSFLIDISSSPSGLVVAVGNACVFQGVVWNRAAISTAPAASTALGSMNHPRGAEMGT